MGTNYYAFPKPVFKTKEQHAKNVADCLAKGQEFLPKGVQRVHIGKSSGGWQFLFNTNNWEFYEGSRESITKFLNRSVIVCEYDHVYTTEKFWKMVDVKADGLDFDSYMEQWDTIHPGKRNPYDKNRVFEYKINNLRFSTSTVFF